jgi:hypothetical protein
MSDSITQQVKPFDKRSTFRWQEVDFVWVENEAKRQGLFVNGDPKKPNVSAVIRQMPEYCRLHNIKLKQESK